MKTKHESNFEADEDVCENLIFDKYRHRKHLGYFYFQDLEGAKRNETKRKRIESFMEWNIFYRLIVGLLRGIAQFLKATLLFLPKLVFMGLAACIPSARGCAVTGIEESNYREMEVSRLYF